MVDVACGPGEVLSNNNNKNLRRGLPNMHPGLLPAGMLATIADNDVDPDTIVAEISTIAKSRRYAIFRLITNSGIRVETIETSLDPQVSAYILDTLCDETEDFYRKTVSAATPFSWKFSTDPVVRQRAVLSHGEAWAEMSNSVFHVFFRRSSANDRLLFITQSMPGADPLDAEQLFFCQGLTQVILDQITLRTNGREGAPSRITVREKECLRWCAEGKTSEEIGIILSLSTHTVNHYLISATKKLNAVNRTHAITVAIRQGILDINGEP